MERIRHNSPMEGILQKESIMKQYMHNSLVGKIYLVTSEKGLAGLYWEKQPHPMLKVPDAFLEKAISELEEYFTGKRKTFSIKLDLQGTEFQKKVWKELLKIPYGSTCSYTDIARKISNEKAVRAVGTANGKNPVCIIVPCHRVITSSGELGGYSGGIPRKSRLLDLEKII
jgi:methylated-DNA-[protein]-cysteine S-methyltransferase